jgi:bifunctional enzyme CysN/CysC
MARQLIGEDNFVEVFVDTPLEICQQRDPKGLYRKSKEGRLPNMTGIGSVYEAPISPQFVITLQENSSKNFIFNIVNCLDV